MEITGKSLVAGNWVESSKTFGEKNNFFIATETQLDEAVKQAAEAFKTYGYSSSKERAKFLTQISQEIEKRADDITEAAMHESNLPKARIEGERGRTVGQINLFANHIIEGSYLDERHDDALPERSPIPRPELFLRQRPVGPVAVFGASNFPLAFSTAGGDTASALAAGCPVVVKAHPAHPMTGEIIAQAIAVAIKACDLHPGVFSFIQTGNDLKLPADLVQHPLIQAVGFTGSLKAGRVLFDLCASRTNPIPFFGELGSINPMFILPSSLQEKADSLASGWVNSLNMGAGQFCTNPGLVVLLDSADQNTFIEAAITTAKASTPQTMLTPNIANAYKTGVDFLKNQKGVELVYLAEQGEANQCGTVLLKTSANQFMKNHDLAEEIFGSCGLIVVASNQEELLALAESLQGQLTVSLHMNEKDYPLASKLMPIIERKAGRILANGYPTGVEVCDTMVHSGPYPASTNFGATSVGTMAIRRFLRPVCYQNIPAELLPLK